jgi:plasmid maintenance system antidote protein VapI
VARFSAAWNVLTHQYWMNLQKRYELEMAQDEFEVKPRETVAA